MEYYSAFLKDVIVSFGTKWMGLGVGVGLVSVPESSTLCPQMLQWPPRTSSPSPQTFTACSIQGTSLVFVHLPSVSLDSHGQPEGKALLAEQTQTEV